MSAAGSARPLRLVPVSLYEKLLRDHLQRKSNKGSPSQEGEEKIPRSEPTIPNAAGPVKGQLIIDGDEEMDMRKKEIIDAIVPLMPRPYQRKAKILLQTADIEIQPNSLRVIYRSEREELGSHLVDLLVFTIAPRMIRRRMKNKPFDLERFQALLASNTAIPRSVYGGGRQMKGKSSMKKQATKKGSKKQPTKKATMKQPTKNSRKKQGKISWLFR